MIEITFDGGLSAITDKIIIRDSFFGRFSINESNDLIKEYQTEATQIDVEADIADLEY